MCMFVSTARVRATKIFATRHRGRQTLVYSAEVESAGSNAMVLPIPATPADSIELLDLSPYPRFFDAISGYYDWPPPPPAFGRPGAPLEVFRIGSFEASIVPSREDFHRLDARFRMMAGLQAVLAERYADWPFVVYQFAPGKHDLHPFGVGFESRYPGHLFFPTLHVHDGGHAPPAADYRHKLSAQGARLTTRQEPPDRRAHEAPWVDPRWRSALPPGYGGPEAGWQAPPPPQRPAVPAFVDLDRPYDTAHVFGHYANQDLYAQLDAGQG
jgi:hypothetical protein